MKNRKITITEAQYKKLTLSEDTPGTVKLYHVEQADRGRTPEQFMRTGLWLSHYPDENYGGYVYTFEVPRNIRLASQETAEEYIEKYDRAELEYQAEFHGEEEVEWAMEYVLIDPESSLSEGSWAGELRDSGYDGFKFEYSGYDYYYLFNPKIATLVDQRELTNYDDFETAVLNEEEKKGEDPNYVKLYHTSHDGKEEQDFTRTGLWLSDYPDEAYGGMVYVYEVPKSVVLADQDVAMNFALKYNKEGVKYAASMAGIDTDDDYELKSCYDEVLIDPERNLGEGQWAGELKNAGYDGFCFEYGGGMYTYYYFFDPNIARLVKKQEFDNYDDFESAVLNEEYHEGVCLSGPERGQVVQEVCDGLLNDPDVVVTVSKMPPKAVKRFKGARRIQIQGKAGFVDAVGFIQQADPVIEIAVVYRPNTDYVFTEKGDPDREYVVAYALIKTLLEEHGHLG